MKTVDGSFFSPLAHFLIGSFIFLELSYRSLLFNMLSRLVIALLPRSKHLLISWLQSLSAVILETLK